MNEFSENGPEYLESLKELEKAIFKKTSEVMDVITGEDDLGMQGYIMFGMQYAILNAQHVATQIEINQIEKKPLWVTSDKQHELQGLLDALSHARNGEFLPMSDIFNRYVNCYGASR